jgi:hypothetical protein
MLSVLDAHCREDKENYIYERGEFSAFANKVQLCKSYRQLEAKLTMRSV